MSTSINNQTTLDGLFKQVYGSDIKDLVPEQFKLLKMVPFGQREALGKSYLQPVYLQLEHGVTYAGAGEDGVALEAAVAGKMEEATVQGTQIILRSQLGYKAAAASAKGGDKSFKAGTKFLVANMLKSISKRLEIMLMYGQSGLALVSSAASTVITLQSLSWAPGIWVGAENMGIEIRDTTGATVRGNTSVVSVDFDAKTVTTLSAIAGLTSGDVIWFKGAYGKEFAGLNKIITNTGSLFGIDASTYALWKGSSYDASGVISFTKVQAALIKGIAKGLDEDVTLIVNPRAWAELNDDLAALASKDYSYKPAKGELGHNNIVYHSMNGKIEVVSSLYCKEGDAFLICKGDYLRIGAEDVTFNRPGKGGEIFFDMPNNSAYELRCYCDQALFCNAPGKSVKIYGITY